MDPHSEAEAFLANEFRRKEYILARLLKILFRAPEKAKALGGYFEHSIN